MARRKHPVMEGGAEQAGFFEGRPASGHQRAPAPVPTRPCKLARGRDPPSRWFHSHCPSRSMAVSFSSLFTKNMVNVWRMRKFC